MTQPEARLWQVLRTRPGGFRFRKQHPIGTLALDFYCPAAKLAIEVDGDAHDMGDNPRRDSGRDAWVATRGIRTLRITAAELYGDIEPAVRLILAACAEGPSTMLTHGPPPHEASLHKED